MTNIPTKNTKTKEREEGAMETENSRPPSVNSENALECTRRTRSHAANDRVAVIRVEKIDQKVVIKKPGPKSMTLPSTETAVEGPSVEPVPSEEPNMDVKNTEYFDSDEEILRPPKKRKRGRPETTEQYRILLKERGERAKREEEYERAIMESRTPIQNSKAFQCMKDVTREYVDDLKAAPKERR